jgi:arginyl-tRNA synthetase
MGKEKKVKVKSTKSSVVVPVAAGTWFFASQSCAENLACMVASDVGGVAMVVAGAGAGSEMTLPALPAVVTRHASGAVSPVFGAVNVVRCLLNGTLSVAEDDFLELCALQLCSVNAAAVLKSKPAGVSAVLSTLAATAPHTGTETAAKVDDLAQAEKLCLKLKGATGAMSAVAPLLAHTVLTVATNTCPALVAATEKAAGAATDKLVAAAVAVSPIVPNIRALPSPANGDNIDYGAGIHSALVEIFSRAIAHALPELKSVTDLAAKVTQSKDAKMGDYQCNSAMALCKVLKNFADKKVAATLPAAPRDVADHIVAAMPANSLIESTNSVNGFINIKMAQAPLKDRIVDVVVNGVQAPRCEKKNVLVDFSSPNIAKDMHVGHLRSTILGDAVCKILEFIGHDVARVNHVGDWGTQFGMLITYMKEAYPDLEKERPNIQDLTALYKASKKRFDEDENFKATSRANVVKLQSGDAESHKIWNILCDVSRAEFQIIYDALGVTLTEVGESFYNPLIPGTIEELAKLGLVKEDMSEGHEGMLIIHLPHFDIPLIMRKSNGGYGYDSTDMAAIRYRTQELKREWIVYVTDAGQGSHFHMCFDAGKEAGWCKDVRLDHIGFGVVCGEDGGKFKTRSGSTVRLIDLLNEGRDRMKASLEARAAEGKCPLSPEEIDVAATKIGYGAVKYFDMKQDPATNYIFSYDRMLSTSGNTAVYLLFAYARIASIIRKAEERGVDIAALSRDPAAVLTLEHVWERTLAMRLAQFGDVIRMVMRDLLPYKLTDYLYELCTDFTSFVTNCHVLNSEEMNSRLLLCVATKKTMAKCFYLLGIEPLERI